MPMSEHQPTVLMVGATGRFASLVLPELVRRGARVRALLRSGRDTDTALGNGAAEIAIGDLRDPQSLLRATEGVDGVFHIGPAFSEDEARMGCNLVAAAKAAGARKFVFSSVIQPTHATLANHASKLAVETALFESDLEYTILHPANFFQNLGAAWPGIVETGFVAEPFPVTTRVARVDYRDVAEVAAIALTGSHLAWGTFELCAPDLLNRLDIATIASVALGRLIEARQMGFDEWAAAARLPLDAYQLRLLAKVHEHYAAHGLAGNALTLRAILGREPRSMRQYIGELAAATAA